MVKTLAMRTLWTSGFLALVACGGSPTKRPAMEPESNDTSDQLSFLSGDGGASAQDNSEPEGLSRSLGLLQGSEEGARNVLDSFMQPDADFAELTSALRPTTNDYAAIFDAQTAAKIEKGQAKAWNSRKTVLKPKAGQTEIKLWSATGTELANGSGSAKEFPAEYQKFGKHLVPSVLVYRFKFVEPGKDTGTGSDGLVFVNGHWVLAPKPWRALENKGMAFDDDDKPSATPKTKPKGKRR